jgi:hypothetical protein
LMLMQALLLKLYPLIINEKPMAMTSGIHLILDQVLTLSL